eukprot:SAG11_NODE_1886_length_4117_cov_2.494027_2_plen_61_part_00
MAGGAQPSLCSDTGTIIEGCLVCDSLIGLDCFKVKSDDCRKNLKFNVPQKVSRCDDAAGW